jgi:ABC-type bacteriocin/lantibiotic exporter with double-glycine peptidase domain
LGGLRKTIWLSYVAAAVSLVLPYASRLLIDKVYGTGDETLMYIVVGSVFAISVAIATLNFLQSYCERLLVAQSQTAAGLMFFNHLQHLPQKFFDTHQTGELLSRFQDVRTAFSFLFTVIQVAALNCLYITIIPPLLFWMNWQLTLVALLSVPVTITISMVTGSVQRKYMKRSVESNAVLGAYQTEMLRNIRLVKGTALEASVLEQARTYSEDALNSQLRAGGTSSTIRFVNAVVKSLGALVFSWFAWKLILEGKLTLGAFFAFSAYVAYFVGPLHQVVNTFWTFQQASVSLGRMFEYLDTCPEQDPINAYRGQSSQTRIPINGSVRFDKVSFGYDGKPTLLSKIDFSIPEGTIAALTGPSGIGKSSLLRLITRIEHPQDGRILLGGKDIKDLPLSEVRRHVVMVGQELTALYGSIWDNLTFGVNNPSIEQVNYVLEACQLADLVNSLPNGVHTRIAEAGANLSGGECQRLAIARACLRRPSILLLDEPTANLDTLLEERLLRGVLQFNKSSTIILVTHRPIGVGLADTVLSLEGGALHSVNALSRDVSRMRGMNGVSVHQ